MKAISVRQPWAWLIVNGHKDIENRDWRTNQRGPVQIHAAKTMTQGDYDACALFVSAISDELKQPVNLPLPSELPLGGIVGEAEIVDCVESSDSPWFTGRYGFVLANAKKAAFQACKGLPGFFEPQIS